MFEEIILFIKDLDSQYLSIFILSMFPITELRGSIPYAILGLKMHWLTAALISVSGNIVVGIVIIYIIGPLMKIFMKINFLAKIIRSIFKKTQKKGRIIDRKKIYGLIVFVGIPLPLTGVWTGSLAAYLFGLSKGKSVLAIIIGVLFSSFFVTLLSLFGYFVIN